MDSFAFIINILIYFIILFSIYMMFQKCIEESIKSLFRIISRRKRKDPLYEYIRKIIISIYDIFDERELETKIFNFYVMTISIFMLVFIVFLRYSLMGKSIPQAILSSLLLATICSLIPYGILLNKLLMTQSDSSKDATIVVTTLLNQYRIYNFNMIAAIDATILALDDNVITRRYLMRLSMRIKEYRSEKELIKILNEFSFAVNTNWIRMLSDAIFFSVNSKIDVTLSLNGIIKQIKLIDDIQNTGKRLNNEAFVMAKFLAPTMFLIMVGVCIKMMGMKLDEILFRQVNGHGLMFLYLMIGLGLASYVIEYLYKHRKFDF